MLNYSYTDPEYVHLQASITKQNWSKGKYDFLKKPFEKRICEYSECKQEFFVKPYEKKKFCCSHCSGMVKNKGRVVSEQTKLKMSEIAKKNHFKPPLQVPLPRIEIICNNPDCRKKIALVPYLAKRRKYCSNKCVMQVVGHQTTSPKASKGKPGIRLDISPKICFYSTWEANVARVFNFQGIEWIYAPKIFDLGEHTYRPDFYLVQENKYIEVKNFMNPYSLERDQQFRKIYPQVQLEVINKTKYKQLELQYKRFIRSWE